MSYRTMKWATRLLICGASVWSAGIVKGVDIYVRAEKTSLTLPDGTPGGKTVQMWGLIQDTDNNFATLETTAGYGFRGSSISLPTGNGGNTLILHLFNRLDVPTSAVIPGQNGYVMDAPHATFVDGDGLTRARSFVKEIAPGAVGLYRWNNTSRGTFLVHSGSHPAVQLQMGLYMPLIRNVSGNVPYPGYTIQSPRQVTLLLSEIDPAVHDAVQNGDYGTTMTSTIHSRPQYYLINGRAYSQAAPPPPINVTGNANNPVLLRLLNAGIDYHVPTLNGLHVKVIAEDGRMYPYAKEECAVALPALKTMDAVVTPPPGVMPLYDRRLGLANGAQSPGGMLVYLDN